MPVRHRSHAIGDLARSEVMRVCSLLGWTSEVIHSDYGEDLLVQTNYNGRLDHFRMFFQVKGTARISRYRTKRHGCAVRVGAEHALRWIRSQDLVVLVLWDTSASEGFFAIPEDQVDTSAVSGVRNVRFSLYEKFDAVSGRRIEWMARLRHYTQLLHEAQTSARTDGCGRERELSLEVLRVVGVLEEHQVAGVAYHRLARDFIMFFRNHLNSCDERRRTQRRRLSKALLGKVAVLSLVDWVQRYTLGALITDTVLVHCVPVVLYVFSAMVEGARLPSQDMLLRSWWRKNSGGAEPMLLLPACRN